MWLGQQHGGVWPPRRTIVSCGLLAETSSALSFSGEGSYLLRRKMCLACLMIFSRSPSLCCRLEISALSKASGPAKRSRLWPNGALAGWGITTELSCCLWNCNRTTAGEMEPPWTLTGSCTVATHLPHHLVQIVLQNVKVVVGFGFLWGRPLVLLLSCGVAQRDGQLQACKRNQEVS